MGDRFVLKLKCAYCEKENEAYYAESCGVTAFDCEFCKKVNEIVLKFIARKSGKKLCQTKDNK